MPNFVGLLLSGDHRESSFERYPCQKR